MTNAELLNEAIENSGVSKSYIARKMGVSRTRLYHILAGSDCRASEIMVICDALHLNDKQKDAIFFAR